MLRNSISSRQRIRTIQEHSLIMPSMSSNIPLARCSISPQYPRMSLATLYRSRLTHHRPLYRSVHNVEATAHHQCKIAISHDSFNFNDVKPHVILHSKCKPYSVFQLLPSPGYLLSLLYIVTRPRKSHLLSHLASQQPKRGNYLRTSMIFLGLAI